MKQEYEIRRATRQDQDRIGRAWRKAYADYEFPLTYLFPERYEWLIYRNPFLDRPDQELPIWIASKDGDVAAWTVAMELPMEFDGRTWKGAWGNLAYTLPEHRRQGLAAALQSNYQKTYQVFIGLGMSMTNRKLQYVLGGRTGKPVYVYFKLLKKLDANALYASFLALLRKRMGRRLEKFFQFLGRFGLKAVLGFKLSLLLKAGQRRKKLEDHEKMSVERAGELGVEADRLWRRARDQFSFAVSRDSRYLNWKYLRQPHLDYHRCLFKDTAGQEQGLLVYRMSQPPELPQGIITEIIMATEDVGLERQMLRYAEDRLQEAGAHMIFCGASSDVQQQALEKEGFRMMYVNVPVFTCPEEIWDQIDYRRAMAGQWLLSLGDSDQDMVHVNNQPLFSVVVRMLTGRVPGMEDLEIDPQQVIEEYKRKVAGKKACGS